MEENNKEISQEVSLYASGLCPSSQNYQLFLSQVAAGFPSPADDYLDNPLNLNDYLVKNPTATFMLRVSGDSMINAGIFANDILIVDRSLPIRSGKIVIAILDDEFLVKQYIKQENQIILRSANLKYPDIKISAEDLELRGFEVWGVVVHCLHNL